MSVCYHVTDFYAATAAVEGRVKHVGTFAIVSGDGGCHGDARCATDAANVGEEYVYDERGFAEGEGDVWEGLVGCVSVFERWSYCSIRADS